ncbi:MAG TPA: exosortase/archaeosortase family protein [Phycisphaerae bacterium]|nr:exosortase/archaeosortase family protein [Phycisphaerae bacterium]
MSNGSRVATRRPPRSWGELIHPGVWVQMVVIAVLLVAAYWVPLCDKVIYPWLHDANWSHGPLVPLFSLYFLSTQKRNLAKAQPRTNSLGLALLLIALASYFWFLIWMPMSYPRLLSFVLAIVGVTLYLAGWQVLRVVWFPILFLLLAVPLPDSIYVDVTMPLRKLASQVSASVLSVIPDLIAETSGVTIEYFYRDKPGTLNVEEACSGMRLMMAFFTLGLAMAYLGERPVWQRVIMVMACIPIAVFCNMIRVTTTGLIHVFDYKSLASGTPHELLGLAMLPIAWGLLALIGYVLKNIFVEVADDS